MDEVVANGSSSTNGASAGGGAGGGAGAGASASDSYSKIIDVSDVAAGSVKLPSYSWPSTYKEDEKHYLDVLRGYLQCRTVSSELTYDSAVKLIVSEGKRLGLETEVFEVSSFVDPQPVVEGRMVSCCNSRRVYVCTASPQEPHCAAKVAGQ